MSLPAWVSDTSSTSCVQIRNLPDRPPVRLVPVARPAKPALVPQSAVVNWRMVGTVGAVAWLWVIGLMMGAWAMSGLVRPPEPVLTEAPPPVVQTKIDPVPVKETPAPKEIVIYGPPMPTPEELALYQPAPAPIQVVVAPPPAAPKPEKIGTCGTAVDFLNDPTEAMEKAEASKKLVLMVHVAGDFEDPGFT